MKMVGPSKYVRAGVNCILLWKGDDPIRLLCKVWKLEQPPLIETYNEKEPCEPLWYGSDIVIRVLLINPPHSFQLPPYRKLLPTEGFYNFREFNSPPLDNAYFQAKPMVLLLGEYSVGKTSFIKHLLERPFPAMQIGPEPTTGSLDSWHLKSMISHGISWRLFTKKRECCEVRNEHRSCTVHNL